MSLSVAEQTFAGTGHMMATARGQQRFPGVDVGASVGSAGYAPGVATFQDKGGQTVQFGTVSTPDLARMQARQAAADLKATLAAANKPQPSASHAEAARTAPSGKGGGRGI